MKGISFDQRRQLWRARTLQPDERHIGYYERRDQAEQALATVSSAVTTTAVTHEKPSHMPMAFPQYAVPVVSPLQLDWQRWLYIADVHAPLHHTEWLQRLTQVAMHEGYDRLLIGGDFFDFASSSHYPATERQANLQQTLTIGGDVLVTLARVFDEIVLLPGNHDDRVSKKLNEPLDFAMLVHAALQGRCVDQIRTTNYSFCYVGPAETGWICGHPLFHENNPVGLGRIAMRERRNVLGSHTHLLNSAKSPDNRYWCVYPGHMSNVDQTPYVQRHRGFSKYAEWCNGFVGITPTHHCIYADGLIDWSVYGS